MDRHLLAFEIDVALGHDRGADGVEVGGANRDGLILVAGPMAWLPHPAAFESERIDAERVCGAAGQNRNGLCP